MTKIDLQLKKAEMKTKDELSNDYEFFRYPPNYFHRHHGDAATSEVSNSNFGLEFAHGAYDYGATKMYIIYDGTYFWFINDGNYSTPEEVENSILKIKSFVGHDAHTTSFFGLGSTKITATRLGAFVGLYTMRPNNYDIYSVNYPSYFDIDNLNFLNWRKLDGNDVTVTRKQVDYVGYMNSFPSHIMEHLTNFKPNWVMKIKHYSESQTQRIDPDWSILEKEMNMVFVDKNFEFEFIDLTRKTHKVAGKSSTLYFPTLPKKGKNGEDEYIKSTTQLTEIVDKKTKKPLNFIYTRPDGIKNTFKVYHYHAISKQTHPIEYDKLLKVAIHKNRLFIRPNASPSHAYVHVFDHTGKYLWSFNAETNGLSGEQYNYSNLVLVLVEGQLEYNIIKTKGLDDNTKRLIVTDFKKYMDSNKQLQNINGGKGEDIRVKKLRDIMVGEVDDENIKKNLINSLSYIAQKSGLGIDEISYDILENHKSHSNLKQNPSGEIDWSIGKDRSNTILIEAMVTGLDLKHIKHINLQLDSLHDEVKIGILLIDGSPISTTASELCSRLETAQSGRNPNGSLKAIWCIRFEDFQNNNISKFVQLDLSRTTNNNIQVIQKTTV